MMFIDGYLMLEKSQLRDSWNGGIPLLNRLLWSNLESLPKNIFQEIMSHFLSDIYISQADSKKLKRLDMLNKRLDCPINFIEKLKEIGKQKVHNAFHFEALRFCKKSNYIDGYQFFIERIDELNKLIQHGKFEMK